MKVVFTFDDNTLDALTWFENYRKPCTVFLCPGLCMGLKADYPINKTHFPITLEHAKYLSVWPGAEIGCHTFVHSYVPRITEYEFDRDLILCALFFKMANLNVFSFAYPDHKEAYPDIARKHFKYIRPIPSKDPCIDPMVFGDLLLYVWHRSPEGRGLYWETKDLIDKGAEFLTLRDACEKGLIPQNV